MSIKITEEKFATNLAKKLYLTTLLWYNNQATEYNSEPERGEVPKWPKGRPC